MAGKLETTFGIEGRETRPGGPKLWGTFAGKFRLWGRAKLKPGGGINDGLGEVGKPGDGAGEALWTSSSLLWPDIVGCSGGFKQL